MLAFIVRLKARALVLAAAAVLLTGGVAAAGSVPRPAASAAPGPAASAAMGTVQAPSVHQALFVRHGSHGKLNAAQTASAAQTCASHATAAGWANNGSLVTAGAVCVAESGGQSRVYYCDTTGHDGVYPPVACSGIYDRGLWQLDSVGQSGTSDACAFDAQCNANAAYLVSGRGTNFAAWAVYTSGGYSRYVSAVRVAVDGLRSGTVASALLGVCLARSHYAVNAPVVIGSCGTGVRQQQWSAAGGTIRSGQLCAAVASTAVYAKVRLRTCDGLTWQEWTPSGTGQLRNAATGGCLRDPGASLVAGTQVTVAPCVSYASRRWWLP
jgi:hypothetical protein